MRIAKFSADSVMDRAIDFWRYDLESGNFEPEDFEEWLYDNELITKEYYENGIDDDPDYLQVINDLFEVHGDSFIDDTINYASEVPDKYLEKACDACRDEAEEHGYYARFTD